VPPPLTKPGTRKLSEVARHVVVPTGITTSGYPAVRDKCRDLGILHDDWQQGLGRLILGKRENGKYAATVGGIVMSIPRQVGKTFTVGSIVVALCLLNPGMTVLWTAHRTRTSNETFAAMKGMTSRSKVKPFMFPPRGVNGEQEIRFRNGSRILFGARETGFGRGFSEVDIEVFDEAQILTERALEDMVAATNQARHPAGALLFYMGTPPRPIDPSEAFSTKRSKALAGETTDQVYVELSADIDADPDDLEQVARANPSFPDRTPLESILRLRENLPSVEAWLREGLGIWDPKVSTRVIDELSWSAVADSNSMAYDRLTLAVDVSPNRSTAAVSLAGRRPDGLWHVELDEHRKGADWVPGWIEQRSERNKLHAVVADEMSGLVETDKRGRHVLKGTEIEVTLAAAEGRDMAKACAAYYDAVMTAAVRHTDQPQVNVALSLAGKRPVAGAWAWNRRDEDSDITPVVSQTLALWGAQNDNVKRPTRRTTSGRRAVLL
jgi:phage terminase large subunit-like protein